MNMKKRIKTKAVTMYVDPKYTDKIDYIKQYGGITAWFEQCLDNMPTDPDKMRLVKELQKARAK